MSDKRISQLVERVTIANNDVLPIVALNAATTNKVTISTIQDWMQTNLNMGVTSVALSVPTGLSVTGSPITSTGIFAISFTAGYSIPTTAKQTEWDTAYTNRITSATAPLGIASNVISITQSGASSNGYLSSTDWNTFNNKQSTITTGNLTEATSSILTITGGTSAVLGSGTSIEVKQASGSQDGFLDSADWTTFNNKQNALSGSGIVKSTGGTITYLTDSTSNWDSAYNDKINSAAVTGTTTKTLTLTQQDGGTIVATWTDDNTDAVSSVFGRTGAVIAVSGDYNTSQVTENTNLYYTDARARSSISLTTTGTTGVSTYNSSTGVINIPNYTPDLSGFVPYTGATTNVNLGTHSLTAADLVINHASGSGVAASITKGGNGEALTVVKTSGSGNAASITGGVTLLSELHLTTDLADTYIASATNWNAAYNDKINSAAVTGTTTKTLTLTQQDGGTITASWTDINTDAVSSVFGRTGAVVATSGDYNTDQVTEGLSSLYFTNARSRSSITLTTTGTSGAASYNSTTGVLNIPSYIGGVTSVNTLTGAVVLTTNEIAEGVNNLYFTNTRARAAITLTTTGTSGAATYSGGVLNIPNYSTDLSGYVPYTGASSNLNLGIYSITTGSTATFNASNSIAAIFTNSGNASNYNSIELRGGTAGTSRNWQISKDNIFANAFELAASTTNGGTIYASPVFRILNTGAATFTGTIVASNLSGTNTGDQDLSGYVTIGTNQTITGIKTFSGIVIVNGNILYVNGGQPETRYTENDVGALPLGVWRTVLGGDAFYIQKNTALAGDFATSISCLQFANTGAATFSGNVNINGAPNDADIALVVKASSGVGKWVFFGRDSANIMTSKISAEGAATFASDLTVNGNAYFNNYIASNVSFVDGTKLMMRQPSMSIDSLKASFFGYSSGYGVLIVGHTGNNNRSLAFGVDVSANPSGAFSGAGNEYIWRGAASFITPNASNNGYNTLMSWNSSGQVTINNLVTTGLTVGSNLTLGDYTSSTSLTFASSSNGIAKINFYDANSTEGLYLRTDGEQHGGTMTFGARWDDDEAKIVFKMYQTSAGASYDVRVGIGTGASSPSSMLHVCALAAGNYAGTFQVGGSSSSFGIVSDYTQSALTTGTMYVSPGYSSAGVLFKMGAGSGNTNQFVLTGAGNIGVGTATPVTTNLKGSVTIIKSYNGDTPTSTTAQGYDINQSNLYLFGRNAGITLVSNNGEEGIIAFANASSAYIGAIRYGTGTSATGGDMVFQTGGSNERLRISSTGTASFTNNVYAVGSFVAASSTTAEIRLQGGSYGSSYNTSLRSIAGAIGILQFGNNNDNYVLVGNTAVGGYLDIRTNCSTESTASGTLAIRILASGGTNFYNTITSTSDIIAYYSSDKRLKDNIKNIENGIDKIKKLNGVSFNWNDKQDIYEIGKKDYGVIAQDVENILPELVETRGNGYKAVKYEKLISLLIEGIKEQQVQIDELKKQVA
jgi:hypothetical protein